LCGGAIASERSDMIEKVATFSAQDFVDAEAEKTRVCEQSATELLFMDAAKETFKKFADVAVAHPDDRQAAMTALGATDQYIATIKPALDAQTKCDQATEHYNLVWQVRADAELRVDKILEDRSKRVPPAIFQGPTRPIHCSSQRAGDMIYTDCR
jgi:hypothetical protein